MTFLSRLSGRLDAYYARNRMWKNKGSDSAANRRTLVSPSHLIVNIGGAGNHAYELAAAAELDLDTAANWDDSQYATPANRAGKDFYIYACVPTSGYTPDLILSAAVTYPAGYTADNSRMVGGFHCECVAVGTISGHSLTGYLAGDIIPRGVWDLSHRSSGLQAGMVWAGKTDFDSVNLAPIWVMIYLASGTGASTRSANGATISDTRDWMSFADDFAAIGCRMMEDDEFQVIAAGSNEETNIAGSADPVTTGGHLDTASRRMVSNIGCEDCCGALFQWLRTQSFQCNPDGTVVTASKTATVYHVASPGGNPIYAKFLANGEPYLCCNMANDAVDKWLTLGTDYKVLVKHDADAATGSTQIYFDDDGTQLARIVANLARGKTCYLSTNNPTYALQITHSATASSVGVALYYDDGADERLEATLPSATNAIIDLALLSQAQAFSYYDLPGSKGSLAKQGTYGDVKLQAGGNWAFGAHAGSRCRYANAYRWIASSGLGCRGCAESA
ncbi:hypothetical protein M0R72_18695 [Candidatus Pacearchaeota archaeon]|nr:hypothetical protein [Candidatus Pacearchaeota archaeon]